jgi:hypothetical protein
MQEDQAEVTARRMAQPLGVKTLYKFRGCRTAKAFENLTGLLQGVLWFSPMREFNDPFEGRPCCVPAHADPEKQRAAMLAAAERLLRFHGAPESALKLMREQASEMPLTFTGEHTSGLHEMLGNDMHVFSMSASRDHPLQWSHYADEHRGVCVHMNAEAMPIAAALRVEYSDVYPAIPQPADGEEAMADNFTRCALTKALWWSYEQEFRIVGLRPKDAAERAQWPLENRAWACPRTIVSGLTLGARMEDPTRKKLLEWCRLHRPDLPLFDASLHDTAYKLEFAPAMVQQRGEALGGKSKGR